MQSKLVTKAKLRRPRLNFGWNAFSGVSEKRCFSEATSAEKNSHSSTSIVWGSNTFTKQMHLNTPWNNNRRKGNFAISSRGRDTQQTEMQRTSSSRRFRTFLVWLSKRKKMATCTEQNRNILPIKWALMPLNARSCSEASEESILSRK